MPTSGFATTVTNRLREAAGAVLCAALLWGAIPAAVAQPTDPPPDTGMQSASPGDFPDWMDKVTFPGDERKRSLGPREPVDPDPSSAMRPPTGPGSGRFSFTPPKMPDFQALRKKGWKTSYARVGSGSDTVLSEAFRQENLDAERHRYRDLAARIMCMPDNPKRRWLQERLDRQKQRLDAAEELATLLASETADADAAGAGTASVPWFLDDSIPGTLDGGAGNQAPGAAASDASAPAGAAAPVPAASDGSAAPALGATADDTGRRSPAAQPSARARHGDDRSAPHGKPGKKGRQGGRRPPPDDPEGLSEEAMLTESPDPTRTPSSPTHHAPAARGPREPSVPEPDTNIVEGMAPVAEPRSPSVPDTTSPGAPDPAGTAAHPATPPGKATPGNMASGAGPHGTRAPAGTPRDPRRERRIHELLGILAAPLDPPASGTAGTPSAPRPLVSPVAPGAPWTPAPAPTPAAGTAAASGSTATPPAPPPTARPAGDDPDAPRIPERFYRPTGHSSVYREKRTAEGGADDGEGSGE